MNLSWKTNLFGVLAGVGLAVTNAIATGAIHAGDLPQWVVQLAALLATLGTAGVGLSARDNDKTSEDVGAPNAIAGTPVPIRRNYLVLLVLVAAVAVLSTGCQVTRSTVRYELGPDGKTNAVQLASAKGPFYEHAIMKHSTRFFGFQAKTDAKTQTPYVVLGFGSEVDEIIPTATGTNGISAPRVMSSFRLDNSINPFDTKIHEDSGAGDVYIGGTNDVSKAIVPAPYVPQDKPK